MRPGDPHAQDSGSDGEAKWGLQYQRLAVDAGSDWAVGADLELRGRPLPSRPLRQVSAPAAPVRGAGDRDAEQAVVDPRPGARTDRPAESVPVVGDQDRRAGGVLASSGPGPLQVEPGAFGPEHVGQCVKDRPDLGLAIALTLRAPTKQRITASRSRQAGRPRCSACRA